MKAKKSRTRVYRTTSNNSTAQTINAFAKLAGSLKGYSAGRLAIFLSVIPFFGGFGGFYLLHDNIFLAVVGFSVVMAIMGGYLEYKKKGDKL